MSKPQINLSNLESIPTKKTVCTLNSFILTTIESINRFEEYSEESIYEFEKNLEQLDSKLLLLESKLDSIPPEMFGNLQKEIKSPEKVPTVKTEITITAANIVAPPPLTSLLKNQYIAPKTDEKLENIEEKEEIDDKNEEKNEEKEKNDGKNENKDENKNQAPPDRKSINIDEIDENLRKYVTMFKVGIPIQGIQQKMMREGVDPNKLSELVDISKPPSLIGYTVVDSKFGKS